MNPENADADVETSNSTSADASEPATTKAPANKVENVADAFNDLFN